MRRCHQYVARLVTANALTHQQQQYVTGVVDLCAANLVVVADCSMPAMITTIACSTSSPYR